MSPPQAAAELGLPVPMVADLLEELRWPNQKVDVGLVELAGGLRSPQAADGDALDVVQAVRPDAAIVVADAGLGTLNAIFLVLGALEATRSVLGFDVRLVLNRFSEADALHRSNRTWLEGHIPDLPIFTVSAGADAGVFATLLAQLV